jgi:hypothetical protein
MKTRVSQPETGITVSTNPSPGGVAQLVERVLYHCTRRAVPERSWVQSLLPTTEVEPGFSTFGGMLVPVLQLISPVCKTGTSLYRIDKCFGHKRKNGSSACPKFKNIILLRPQNVIIENILDNCR